MSEKMVTTFDGKRITEENGVFLQSQNKWYEKGVTAFQVNYTKSGKPQWYRFDHPYIAFDEGKNEYVDTRVVTLKPIIIGWEQTSRGWTEKFGKTSGSSDHLKWARYEDQFVKDEAVIAQQIARELNISEEKAHDKMFRDPKSNIYYDYTSDNVVEDCNLPGEVVLKTAAEKIVIGFHDSNGKPRYGWSKSPEAGIQVSTERYPVKWVSDESIAEEMGLKEDIYDGIWKDRPTGKYGKRRHYEFMHDPKELQAKIEKSNNLIAEGLPYSWGLECETSIGYVPVRVISKYPVKCVRDGSLPEGGAEYVTDVLGRDYGFNVLEGLLGELSRRCKVDHQCAVHVHVGNVPCTPEFNVALYSLCEKIQDEVFSMLPYSRIDHKYNEKYQIRKNYCKPLKRLFYKPSVSRLLNAMRGGEEYASLLESLDDKVNEHVLASLDGETELPVQKDWKQHYNRETKRHAVNNKFHRAQRYEWMSLCSYTFDPGCHIENRAHSSTLSYRKISNWIKLTMAIAWYAQNRFEQSMDPNFAPTLDEIVDFAYPKTGASLKSYIAERKDKFNKGVENNQDRAKVEESEYNEKNSL